MGAGWGEEQWSLSRPPPSLFLSPAQQAHYRAQKERAEPDRVWVGSGGEVPKRPSFRPFAAAPRAMNLPGVSRAIVGAVLPKGGHPPSPPNAAVPSMQYAPAWRGWPAGDLATISPPVLAAASPARPPPARRTRAPTHRRAQWEAMPGWRGASPPPPALPAASPHCMPRVGPAVRKDLSSYCPRPPRYPPSLLHCPFTQKLPQKGGASSLARARCARLSVAPPQRRRPLGVNPPRQPVRPLSAPVLEAARGYIAQTARSQSRGALRAL